MSVKREQPGTDLLAHLGSEAPSARMRARLAEAIGAERARSRRPWVLAAALVFAVGGLVLWRGPGPETSAVPPRVAIAGLSSDRAPLSRIRAIYAAAPLLAGGRGGTESSSVEEALTTRLLHDPDDNVRLAALDVLASHGATGPLLAASLEQQSSAVVQAHLLAHLRGAGIALEPATIEQLLARPALDPTVRALLSTGGASS